MTGALQRYFYMTRKEGGNVAVGSPDDPPPLHLYHVSGIYFLRFNRSEFRFLFKSGQLVSVVTPRYAAAIISELLRVLCHLLN